VASEFNKNDTIEITFSQGKIHNQYIVILPVVICCYCRCFAFYFNSYCFVTSLMLFTTTKCGSFVFELYIYIYIHIYTYDNSDKNQKPRFLKSSKNLGVVPPCSKYESIVSSTWGVVGFSPTFRSVNWYCNQLYLELLRGLTTEPKRVCTSAVVLVLVGLVKVLY
jgi:hypothetical protein